jgi:hypothetical protein
MTKAPLPPGLLYQDAAHGLGRGGEEVTAAVPVRRGCTTPLAVHQSQIREIVHPGWCKSRVGTDRLGLAGSNVRWYDGAVVRLPVLCPTITETIMSDTPTPELIESLRRSVRRWRTLSLTLLAALGLVIIVGTGTAVLRAHRARQAEEAARQAAMEARQRAEDALDQARRHLYVAQMTLAQQEWEHRDVARAKELLEQPRPKDAAKDAAGK